MGLKEIACLLLVVACASSQDYQGCATLFGFFPDSYDCTKFYRCSWGRAFQFTCAPGTRWSQSLLTCDHAAKVPCASAPLEANVYHAVPVYPDRTGYYDEPAMSVPYSHPVNPGYYDFVNNYKNDYNPMYQHKK